MCILQWNVAVFFMNAIDGAFIGQHQNVTIQAFSRRFRLDDLIHISMHRCNSRIHEFLIVFINFFLAKGGFLPYKMSAAPSAPITAISAVGHA